MSISSEEAPIFREIAERIRRRILEGKLSPGSRLPSVREYARELGVAVTTVQRAYRELSQSGLIITEPASGTFVTTKLARKAGTEILTNLKESGPHGPYESIANSIGLLSLATAVPDPMLFKADDFLGEIAAIQDSPWTWYYGAASGSRELRDQVARLLRRRGIAAQEDEILITSGSLHAISLILQTLKPSCVLYEEPTLLILLDLFEQEGCKAVPIPLSAEGLDNNVLQREARANPGAILITSSSFQWATGQRFLDSNRAETLAVATETDIQVIEADRYRDIAFAPPAPPLAAADPNVIYIDTFTYSVSTGLRIAFIKCNSELQKELARRSWNNGTTGPQYHEIAFANYLKHGSYALHLARVVPQYQLRRDTILSALELSMPREATWSRPDGGYALWLRLPERGRFEGFYELAIARGVAVAPSHLMLRIPDPRQMRLAFGWRDPVAIRSAVGILGEIVTNALRCIR